MGWLTVADVVGRYIEHRVALGKVGEKAAERYWQLLRLNIEPHIGSVKIRALHKSHVSGLITTLLRARKLRAKGAPDLAAARLSATTVHHAHALLKSALAWAVSVDIVARNAADIEDGPQRTKSDADALTDEELGALLIAVRASRWEPLFMFALATGLRRGEIAALSRDNVQVITIDGIERGSAIVKASFSQTKAGTTLKGTKTGSVRQIPLPPMAIAALRAQAIIRAQDEFAAEGGYRDGGYVFADPLGRPLVPFAITEAFRVLAHKAGVTKRFHDQRHTAVSNLLAAGVDVVNGRRHRRA